MNCESLYDSFSPADPFERLKLVVIHLTVGIIVIEISLVHASLSTNRVFLICAFIGFNYNHFIEVSRACQGGK